MSSTFNVFVKLLGVLSGETVEAGSITAPSTLTTSADVKADKIVTAAGTTVVTVLTVGTGEDIPSMVGAILIPSVAGSFVIVGATAADNSAITCTAGVPVILSSGNTLPYQTTASNRIDETPAAITSISFRNSTATAGKVRVVAIG